MAALPPGLSGLRFADRAAIMVYKGLVLLTCLTGGLVTTMIVASLI
jgi:hypothetical protein